MTFSWDRNFAEFSTAVLTRDPRQLDWSLCNRWLALSLATRCNQKICRRARYTPSILYLTAASVRVGRCADGHAGGCTGGGVGIHGDGGGAKDAAHEYGGNVEELEKEGLK